jgi:pyruvate,water dikinase
MVAADRSGVAFTVNPLTGADEIVINASYGLGDLVVSGVITPDEFIVDRSGRVSTLTIGSKREMTVLTHRGIQRTAVPTSLREAPCLGDSQLSLVVDATRACELNLGFPVDVEWALSDNKLSILQARPVTAIVNKGAN